MNSTRYSQCSKKTFSLTTDHCCSVTLDKSASYLLLFFFLKRAEVITMSIQIQRLNMRNTCKATRRISERKWLFFPKDVFHSSSNGRSCLLPFSSLPFYDQIGGKSMRTLTPNTTCSFMWITSCKWYRMQTIMFPVIWGITSLTFHV
jgi:hypothetical protein